MKTTSRNSLNRLLCLAMAFAMSTFGWSQSITVEGPYEVPHAASQHQLKIISNPASVPRSPELLATMSGARSACSDLKVTFTTAFPAGADTAFNFAMEIWENSIESTVPINISVEFTNLASNLVAFTEPNGYFTISGSGVPDTLYARALAEQITGSEIGGTDSVDILISFNDSMDFYYGTDANPPVDEIDFVTLVLHEIGHGLGFIGFGITNGTEGSIRDSGTGFPSIYDRFIENGSGAAILSFADPSTDLHTQLTSDNLFSNGTNATAENSATKPKTYNPGTFDFFKSYDHWDSAVFPSGNINSLMTETVSPGEANHNPGPVTLGFFEDMGWVLCSTLSTGSNNVLEVVLMENPVRDRLQLQIGNNLNGLSLETAIINMAGQRVMEAKQVASGNQLTISGLSRLEDGVYFIQITAPSGDQSITKFVKQ